MAHQPEVRLLLYCFPHIAALSGLSQSKTLGSILRRCALRVASATEVKCEGSGEAPQSARREGPARAFPGGVPMPLTPTVAPPCLPSQDSLDSCRSADSNMPRYNLALWRSTHSCCPGIFSQRILTSVRYFNTSMLP